MQRAVKVAGISEEAKQAARDAGLADNRSALLAVAKESTPEAQVAKVGEIASAKADAKVRKAETNTAPSEGNRPDAAEVATAVKSEKPKTVTAPAKVRKERHQFDVALGRLQELACVAGIVEPTIAARASTNEANLLREAADTIKPWLDRFVAHLPSIAAFVEKKAAQVDKLVPKVE